MPNVIRIEAPLLIDACVDMLQTELSTLTYSSLEWIETIYPLAEISEKEKLPQYRIKRERYENIVPNNRLKSFSFFFLHSDKELNLTHRIFDLSLTVWFNESKYNTDKFNVREYFIATILKMMYGLHPEIVIGEIFRDKNEVWEGMKHDSFLPFDSPFRAFRIRFTISWDIECDFDLISIQ
jgi:hypothetical protein